MLSVLVFDTDTNISIYIYIYIYSNCSICLVFLFFSHAGDNRTSRLKLSQVTICACQSSKQKENSSWSMSMGFGFLYFSYKCLDNETILFFCKFLKQALVKALFVAPLLRVSGALAMKRNWQCINKTDISTIYTHTHIFWYSCIHSYICRKKSIVPQKVA